MSDTEDINQRLNNHFLKKNEIIISKLIDESFNLDFIFIAI